MFDLTQVSFRIFSVHPHAHLSWFREAAALLTTTADVALLAECIQPGDGLLPSSVLPQLVDLSELEAERIDDLEAWNRATDLVRRHLRRPAALDYERFCADLQLDLRVDPRLAVEASLVEMFAEGRSTRCPQFYFADMFHLHRPRGQIEGVLVEIVRYATEVTAHVFYMVRGARCSAFTFRIRRAPDL